MSYTARVIKVMIASPSDVATERQVARDVIHEWNAVNSEPSQLVLMPVGWESHASPKMGERAQAIINKQILSTCDLLVAVFWTRLGSPTGAYPSGTVEEIREHVQAGKPAMIYFSQQPVRLDSVDELQYKTLLEFKSECQTSGLTEAYESFMEFREKFARHLALTIQRDFYVEGSGSIAVPSQTSNPDISDEAAELLTEAAQDSMGAVLRLLTFEGLGFKTNGKYMAGRGNPKSEARWDSALQELLLRDFLTPSDSKGEVFRVTHAGYNAAENLPGRTRPATGAR